MTIGFFLALCGPIFLGLIGLAVGLIELRRIRARKAKTHDAVSR